MKFLEKRKPFIISLKFRAFFVFRLVEFRDRNAMEYALKELDDTK